MEVQFERNWLSRFLWGEPEWHWIYSYRTLEEAAKARDSLAYPAKTPADWEVVG